MNMEQLDQLLLLHGGDIDRWPESDRLAALALATENPAARRLIETASAADRSVRLASEVAPSGTLAARIVAAATGGGEEAIFNVTPAGVVGALAGSIGLAGIGYAATAALAALIVPVALLDTVTAIVGSGVPGGF